jgi:hypothetical protein
VELNDYDKSALIERVKVKEEIERVIAVVPTRILKLSEHAAKQAK